MLPDVSKEKVYDEATVEELLSREKDGRPLLRRLFEIYREETPRLLGELRGALERKDADEAYDALHQMKGSAAALGARRLFRTTEASLPLCRDGAILRVGNLVETIQTESEQFVHAVSRLLDERD